MEPLGQNFELDKSTISSKNININNSKDNNKDEEPSEKTSFCSLSQRTSLLSANAAVGIGFMSADVPNEGCPPPSSRPTSTTLVGHSNCKVLGNSEADEDDGELTLSECDNSLDIYGEDVDRKRERGRRSSTKTIKVQRGRHTSQIGDKLKEELCKYKQELKEYNETTKELEEKYMKINFELNEMQQKHKEFVNTHGQRSDNESDAEGDHTYYSSTSIASDMSVKPKSGKVFSRNSSFMTVLAAQSSCDEIAPKTKLNKYAASSPSKKNKPKSSLTAQVHSVYSKHIVDTLASRQNQRRKRSLLDEDVEHEHGGQHKAAALKDVYNVLKDVINTTQEHKHKHDRETGEINQLYSTIKNLKGEQLQYRNIIRQQQDRIADYHSRCVKAQDIMKTQKHEIDKLHVNNDELESSIYNDLEDLRSKIDAKLKSVAHLPKLVREEHNKYEKAMRENCMLVEKLHVLQQEAAELRMKIDELGKRKLVTINRLKAAERDLKIFKNYNAALKSEKRRMSDELTTMKEQLESLQATSKRQMTRHRDQSEKQRRDLQKRIFDLELKLSRSQNSTASLIQERDSLIAELQTQLHTLVHNFEVSQKHIRVLRRHIYTMTNGNGNAASGGTGATTQRASDTTANRASGVQTGIGRGSSVSRLNNPRTLKNKT